ncbi:MAG: ribonuclease R [Sphingomonadales bacterium]
MGRKNSKRKQQQRKHHPSAVAQVVKGTLELTRSGMGYVLVDQLETDIMVRPGDLHSALHGDLVKVAIKERKTNGRMQGVVKEVIKRKRSEFIGQLQVGNGFAFFVAETDKPMPDIFIPKQLLQGAIQGDRVVVKVIKWAEGGDKRPMGEVITILKEEDMNDAAMKEILLEAGFPLSFSEEASEESARIPEVIGQEEIAQRRDCRSILTFTIDPVDAKDFDDAISIQQLPNGNLEIGVHIADVSHYVVPNTALDAEAYARATSVYLPDRVNPMLPEHISNVLCSLRPKEEKLTFSAIFIITPQGQIKDQWLGRTVIYSDHRFTYEEVQAIIEEGSGLYAKEILQLHQLARQFRARRFEQGAINFSSQEVRFKLNEKGDPVGIMVKESKESHQLIEEFMLLANRTVAAFIAHKKIDNKPIPFPYRIHDDPDEEKLIPFVDFARKFGHGFDRSSPAAIAASFNQLLQDVKGRPEQHVLEQLGIRTMAKARYTADNVGHYGLGFENYCHFTSPIRRYPDIQAHRILWEVLQQKIQPDKKLEEKCKHTSERERAAMEAERAANKYKQVQYMKNFLAEEFEGIISGVAHFGFWVETIEHKCEGLVSVVSLSDYDDFRHVESDYCLLGMRTGKKFRMGDKVWIKVVAANLTKRQLDYEWVVAGELAAKKSVPKLPKTKK